MSHLEQRLENDLNKVHNKVSEQTGLVIKAVEDAVRALQTGDRQLAYNTVLFDNAINRNMRAIDRLCHRFIAVHLPGGGHLRLLSSVIRVNIALERIGDYAVTIAREAVQLYGPPQGAMARELERFAGESIIMLQQACKAFNELNADMAKYTKVLAAQMEHDLDGLYAEMMTSDNQDKIKDIMAIFVIFTHLKRVADQAKNICEDTVFAVTGEQKAPKIHNILFVDEDNGLLSQMAEAVARKTYPKSGHYRSAGSAPASAIDERLALFLEQHGLDTGSMAPTAISDLTHQEITEQNVIITLRGAIDSYFPKLPFHTTALEWQISTPLDENLQMESLYREISPHIRDLMELLVGEEAA